MNPYGRTAGARSDWISSATETGLEESMWQLGLGGAGGNPSGGGDVYPERPRQADCEYYMRTGLCRFGASCHFNHPRDRSSVARTGGEEYPERVGQPVCQYFLKTGTCKYGATCKFHHPRYEGGSESMVSLSYYGYPLRPGEKECSYYMKTGHCKFGLTCKFNHPQLAGISVPAPAPAFYPTVQSPSVPSQYGMVSWPVVQPPLLPSSYVQGPYGMLVSPGVIQVSGWNPYPPLLSPVASPATPHAVGTSSFYGSMHQFSPSAPAYAGPFSPLSSTAGPSSGTLKEHEFPQRPGQPECQFYMRTGDCKFGSTCRYHHPPEWSMPKTTCALSILGLPLRPGAPPCTFYLQHGVCKFGPTCKFDHPMGSLSYSPSASSLSDMPVVPYSVGSSMAMLAGSNKDSFSARIPSSENMPSLLVGSIISRESRSSFPNNYHGKLLLSQVKNCCPRSKSGVFLLNTLMLPRYNGQMHSWQSLFFLLFFSLLCAFLFAFLLECDSNFGIS